MNCITLNRLSDSSMSAGERGLAIVLDHMSLTMLLDPTIGRAVGLALGGTETPCTTISINAGTGDDTLVPLAAAAVTM